GDFDNDRNLDFASADRDSNNVSIHLGRGDGSFDVTSFSISWPNIHTVVCGDINRDGALDLVGAGYLYDAPVAVAYGDGAGSFSSANTIGIVNLGHWVDVGD
ncbi:MAG: FG-GAP repeat domain-containing protein, partial [bacterium]